VDIVDFRSQIFSAVENRQFEEVDEKKYDMDTFIRKSKRTYPCEQLDDAMIKGYDHFNIYLDSPIGARNQRAFVLFIITYAIYLACSVFLSIFEELPAVPVLNDVPLTQRLFSFSLCRFVWGLLDFWAAVDFIKKIFFIAISVASPKFFVLVICSGLLMLPVVATVVTQVALITMNLTSAEHTKALEDANKRTFQQKYRTQFHEGFFRNFLLFITGRRIQ
jgi:hypothetical protein